MDPTNIKLSSTYPSAPLIYINNYTNENVRHGQIPPPPPIIRVNIKNKFIETAKNNLKNKI